MIFREPSGANNWYSVSAPAVDELPPLAQHVQCDVCIIGGGITGLSAAEALSRQGFKVIVLEGRRVGWSASGRNGGFVIPAVDIDPEPLAQALGSGHAADYWRLAGETVRYSNQLIRQLEIDCDAKQGVLIAANNADHFAQLSAKFLKFSSGFPYEAELIPADGIDRYTRSGKYAGGLYYPGMLTVHPLKLTIGLWQAALKSGVIIHEHSPVAKYEDKSSSVEVMLENGKVVTCGKLLLATNAYQGQLTPSLAKRFVAMYSNMLATAPLPQELIQRILPNGVAVLDTKLEMAYYRLSRDNRLIFGGGNLFTGRDAAVVRPLLTKILRTEFPELADVPVEYVWGGWFGMTMYGDTPDVGQVSANVHYAQAIAMAWGLIHSKLFAENLMGNTDGYKVLSTIDVPRGPTGPLVSTLLNGFGNAVARVKATFL